MVKFTFLKNRRENSMNTTRVIASWITFNWTRLKGPPFSANPIRLAGTWKQYSKKASPQLNNTITHNASWWPFLPKNFRCPYQAIVIKAFDKNNKPIVDRYFPI